MGVTGTASWDYCPRCGEQVVKTASYAEVSVYYCRRGHRWEVPDFLLAPLDVAMLRPISHSEKPGEK